MEAVANEASATPGQEVIISMEFTNRSPLEVELKTVEILPMDETVEAGIQLGYNQENKLEKTITLPVDMPLSNPYWLNEKGTLGRFKVADQKLRGLPETPREFKVKYVLSTDCFKFIFPDLNFSFHCFGNTLSLLT